MAKDQAVHPRRVILEDSKHASLSLVVIPYPCNPDSNTTAKHTSEHGPVVLLCLAALYFTIHHYTCSLSPSLHDTVPPGSSWTIRLTCMHVLGQTNPERGIALTLGLLCIPCMHATAHATLPRCSGLARVTYLPCLHLDRLLPHSAKTCL